MILINELHLFVITFVLYFVLQGIINRNIVVVLQFSLKNFISNFYFLGSFTVDGNIHGRKHVFCEASACVSGSFLFQCITDMKLDAVSGL